MSKLKTSETWKTGGGGEEEEEKELQDKTESLNS